MHHRLVIALLFSAAGVAAAQQVVSSGISLQEGQTSSNATTERVRVGTISGVVTNDRGEPMPGVHVGIWPRIGNSQFGYLNHGVTNAGGAYRITDVPAGDYFVVAGVWHFTFRQGPPTTKPSPCSPPPPPPPPQGALPSSPPAPSLPAPIAKPQRAEGEWFTDLPRWIPEPEPDERGQPRTIPTTIYPGVSNMSQASVLSVRGGENYTGIDLQLLPTRTTTVQGRIVPQPGQKIGRSSEVRLRLPGAPPRVSEHVTWVQPDHTFRFLGVPPGSYVFELQLQEAIACDVVDEHGGPMNMPLDVPLAGLDDLIVPMSSDTTR